MSAHHATGTICTFYSYKGGVGRSMALANVAALLAQWGHRVLCVDWDLEAPGLHLYFEDWLDNPPLRGVLELVGDLAGSKPISIADYTTEVNLPDMRGHLDVMPAGGLDESFVGRVQALDWDQLYADGLGTRLEELRDAFKREYDFVLLDSRTGITDIGGICTVQLPDLIAFCCTPNQQSLNGVLDVMRRSAESRQALPFDRAQVPSFPVITRFEATIEVELAREWMKVFEQRLGPMVETFKHLEVATGDLLAQLRIPHVAHWSFGERLAVIEEGTSDPLWIGHAFETLAAVVAHRTEDTDLLIANREAYVEEAKRLRGNSQAARTTDVFVSFSRSDAQFGRELARELRHRGLRVADDSGPVQRGRRSRARNIVFLVDDDTSSLGEMELQQFLSPRAGDGVLRGVFPVLRSPHARVPRAVSHFFALDAHDSPPSGVADRIAIAVLWQRSNELIKERGIEAPATLAAARRHVRLLIEVGDLEDAHAFVAELESEIAGNDAYDSSAGYEVIGLRASVFEAGADRLRALELRRRQVGAFSFDERTSSRRYADAKVELADALVKANRYDEALGHVAEAHELLARLLGAGAAKTREARVAVGIVLAERGDSEEALELLTRLWDELRYELGARHKLTLKAQTTLAEVRCMAGDVQGGIELQRDVVDRRASRSGSTHVSTLEAQSHLAYMLEAAGAADESVTLRKRVEDAYLSYRGSSRPETLKAGFRYARVLASIGDVRLAVSHVREVLELALERLVVTHPVCITGFATAGAVLRMAGQLAEAAEVLDRGQEAVGRLDADHPLRLMMLDETATTQEQRGYLEVARDLREQIFRSHARVFGETHSQTLTAMTHLAMTQAAMGDFEAALHLNERVVSIAQPRFGRSSELVVRTKQHLAQTLDILGRADEAESLLVEVMRTLETALGEDHVETQRARLALGDLLMRRGAHERSLDEIRRAVETMRATLGPLHPETLSADELLGNALAGAGQITAAETELSATFEQMSRALGPNHPRTLSAGWAWFRVLRLLGREMQALEIGEIVVTGRRALYGDTHPSTVAAMQEQLTLLEAIGDRPGAEAIRRRIAIAVRTPPLV